MSRDQGRYLLIVVLLFAAVGATLWITLGHPLGANTAGGHEFVADIDNWRRTDRERAVTSPFDFNLAADLQALPLQLGDWQGIEVPQTNLEVFILLEPEQYVQRLYERPDGKAVWLSLIGSRKSKSFHSPQICYDADGWQTTAGSEPVPLQEGQLYALRLLATKAVEGGAAEHAVMYFYLWPSYARDPQDGTVLVKVTAPIYDSVEETVALEQAFLNELFTSARE
ncbi:MAG: hypothetical protein BWY52_03164 [Chloroflexi bacterium ADurb.Bin325]|nr:MAG: hypothetical protein BWY52_03164 [Chloroflexi bacterium ADurb.Bin325]